MIERLLARLAAALAASRIPYMLIGGQAVLFYGHARLTQDVDVTLGVDTDEVEAVLAVCRAAKLTPLVKQPSQFARDTHVLPAADELSGLRVDLVFSNTAYERQAIKRARTARVGRATVRFAALEDLIIHKLIAGRPIDLDDTRVLLTKPAPLNTRYIRHWLKAFSMLGTLHHDPLALFQTLAKSSKAARGLRKKLKRQP